MRLIRSVSQLASALEAERRSGRDIALVPTMGGLHAGHLSLLAQARDTGRTVVLSIFVNPTQFDDPADLERYPRPLERDLQLAEAEGAELVLLPSVGEMYPPPDIIRVRASGPLVELWEGASRPGHFDGALTVVGRLFGMAGSCRAYFGEKDFQQLRLVTRLAEEMFPLVEVVPCPIVREQDGLACSSRNALLPAADRSAASVIHEALLVGRDAASSGEDVASVERAVRSCILKEARADVDYVGVVRPGDLTPADGLAAEMRILVACRFGPVRLIDNIGVVRGGPAGSLPDGQPRATAVRSGDPSSVANPDPSPSTSPGAA